MALTNQLLKIVFYRRMSLDFLPHGRIESTKKKEMVRVVDSLCGSSGDQIVLGLSCRIGKLSDHDMTTSYLGNRNRMTVNYRVVLFVLIRVLATCIGTARLIGKLLVTLCDFVA